MRQHKSCEVIYSLFFLGFGEITRQTLDVEKAEWGMVNELPLPRWWWNSAGTSLPGKRALPRSNNPMIISPRACWLSLKLLMKLSTASGVCFIWKNTDSSDSQSSARRLLSEPGSCGNDASLLQLMKSFHAIWWRAFMQSVGYEHLVCVSPTAMKCPLQKPVFSTLLL